MVKLITPKEVKEKFIQNIPEKVYEVWNLLILENWNPSSQTAVVYQKEAAFRLAEAMEVDVNTVYAKKWCDIEDSYRKEGWNVVYDKPAYNETYEATFEFKAERNYSYDNDK